MKNVIAVDVGFGRVKALTDELRMEYPSVVGPWRQIRFSAGIMDGVSHVEQLAVEYIGQKLFLGDAAYRQSKARVNLSMDRFFEAEGMALMLATIALLIPGRDIRCSLVTGLPVNAYALLKKKYEQTLLGRHFIKLLDAAGNRDERYITIDRCKILPQPMGTVFNVILDRKGEISDRGLASSKIAVLDVGQNTLDLVSVDSLDFIDSESTSFGDLGIFECYRQLSIEIYNTFGVEITPEEIEPRIKGNTIKIGGRPRSIIDIKNKSYQDAAEKIVSRVRNFWRSMWQFDRIILSGGGAQIFGEQIARALHSPCEIDICGQGSLSNVRGYLKFGHWAWAR